MFGLLGGLAMLAFGMGCEAYDDIKAVNASQQLEIAPSPNDYNMMPECMKKDIRDGITRCLEKGIPLTQNQLYIYYTFMVERDENGNAIERY